MGGKNLKFPKRKKFVPSKKAPVTIVQDSVDSEPASLSDSDVQDSSPTKLKSKSSSPPQGKTKSFVYPKFDAEPTAEEHEKRMQFLRDAGILPK
jgi:hypothetical protein